MDEAADSLPLAESQFFSYEDSQASRSSFSGLRSASAASDPGPGHPGFVYLDAARASDEQTVYWLRQGGIDPYDGRVVEWDGPREQIETSVRPVPSNVQSTRSGQMQHRNVVMWFALRPGGPAVVELSADAAPIAGDMQVAWGPGVLTIVGHLALPRLR